MKTQPLEFEKPLAELERKLEELVQKSAAQDLDLDPEVRRMRLKIEETKRGIYENLTAWQRVQIARHTARPFMLDYLGLCFTDFVELKGDRLFGDDAAMPGGLATLRGIRCVVVGHQTVSYTHLTLPTNREV